MRPLGSAPRLYVPTARLPGFVEMAAGIAMRTRRVRRREGGHSRAGRPGRHDFPVLAAVVPTWRPSGALRRRRAGLGRD